MTVYPGGRIVLTVPRRVSDGAARAFLSQKSAWVARASARLASLPPPVAPKGSRRDYLARREEARALATALLAKWNARYGFSWRRVRIANQKTRWGSCSRAGTISFSYRIVYLPPALADYLVVHELCHLAHPHHGPAFWAEVARAIPDYRTLRAQLAGRRALG